MSKCYDVARATRNSLLCTTLGGGFFFVRGADLLYFFFHIRRGEKLRFSHINARTQNETRKRRGTRIIRKK